MTYYQITNWSTLYENNRTRELKKLDWVPVPNRMDGDGYTDLLSHPNGASHYGAWMAMLQIASRCDTRGTLLRGPSKPHDHSSLSRISRIPEEIFLEAIPRLIEIGWISVTDCPEPTCTIPQEGAGKCGSAPPPASQDVALKGREGNGREEKEENPCSADAERVNDETLFPIDQPSVVRPTVPAVRTIDGLSPQREGWFSEWWAIYWRHAAKKAARKAFAKQVKTPEQFQRVMDATRAQQAAMLIREEGNRPHGATWLNGERWEDEPERLSRASPQLTKNQAAMLAFKENYLDTGLMK